VFPRPLLRTDRLPPTAFFSIASVQRAISDFPPVFIYSGHFQASSAAAQLPFRTRSSPSSPSHIESDATEPLSLYIAYDEPSPMLKRRGPPSVAPFRFSISTANGSMLIASHGLPPAIHLDASSNRIAWGSTVALEFPTPQDFRLFITGVRRHVALREANLYEDDQPRVYGHRGDGAACPQPDISYQTPESGDNNNDHGLITSSDATGPKAQHAELLSDATSYRKHEDCNPYKHHDLPVATPLPPRPLKYYRLTTTPLSSARNNNMPYKLAA
jgi:hypothetical protein